MRLSPRWGWFAAFTAVFAVFAAYVFWGTWSPDFAPVMPDSPICYSPDWFSDWWRTWLVNGKFMPLDLRVFLGSPYFWQELNYVIPLYLSGLAVAYLLRGRGLPLCAAYGAGLSLAFCGYWMTLFSAGHGSWFAWMSFGTWAFALIDRAVRKNKLKNWLLSGTVVGWACYWQPDLWLLFTVFSAAFFIFCEIENRRKFSWRRLFVGPSIALVAFLAVGGAGIRNAFVSDLAGRNAQIEKGETVADADSVDENEKRWIFVTNWSLPFDETCEFWDSRVNGDTSCPFTLALSRRAGNDIRQYTGALGRPKDAPSGNYRQHSLYVGFATCILALFAFAVSLRKKWMSFLGGSAVISSNRSFVWFFAAAASVCYLCSLGRYCEPVYRIVYALPFGDAIRAPVKWHHLTEFSLVVLAGFGLSAIYGLVLRLGSHAKCIAPVAVSLVVLAQTADLASVDRLYCAPVDLRVAKSQNAALQMTILPNIQFRNPQVAQMLKTRRLVYLGQLSDVVSVVGIIEPYSHNSEPMPPFGVAAWLSVLSMIASCAIVVASAKWPKKTV